MDASRKFQSVAKALDLWDLNYYQVLIETLPNMKIVMYFFPSGFLYLFTNLPFINKQYRENEKSPSEFTDDHLHSRKDSDDIITLSTLYNDMKMDNYEVCYVDSI